MCIRDRFAAEGRFKMASALQKVMYDLMNSSKAVSTDELVHSFGWDTQQRETQQDVQEFFCQLLEALDEKMKALTGSDAFRSFFEGKAQNYIRCIDVDCQSTRTEPFIDIQLTVKDKKTIRESLEELIAEETLDGDNKYETEKFGKQRAVKGVIFESLPPVILFQLKRFEFDCQTMANRKICSRFEYEEEIDLEMLLKVRRPAKYRLFSVLVHSGHSASHGHYFAYIRPFLKKWLLFNDEIVEEASHFQVFNCNFGGSFESFNNTSCGLSREEQPNPTTAYMLVYVSEEAVPNLFVLVQPSEVPRSLKEYYETIRQKDEAKKFKSECLKVFLTSAEQLRNMTLPGLIYTRKGKYDTEYERRFIRERSNRIKFYTSKNATNQNLVDFISLSTGIPPNQFVVLKVIHDRAKMITNGNNYPLKASVFDGAGRLHSGQVFIVVPIDTYKYTSIMRVLSDGDDETEEPQFIDYDPHNTNYERPKLELIHGKRFLNVQSLNDLRKRTPLKLPDGSTNFSIKYYEDINSKLAFLFGVKEYVVTDGEPEFRMIGFSLAYKSESTLKTLERCCKQFYPTNTLDDFNIWLDERTWILTLSLIHI
eukprot:TRINITY_DN22747_c0_g1_i2.p1 TRINITY_DN22747_c0_g1~~TRINITY_DN22747_c0_g1_i2.p1  ORF type:complete len:613 (+),score=109.33 TRINITY_DN22747_c0_g1_i2:60-1841(+)